MSENPNYRVIELEAENNKLKDELISELRKRIDELEYELKMSNHQLINLVKGEAVLSERDTGSNMIAPPNLKPRVRTVSEVQVLLERRSANAANAIKTIEEIENAE